MREYFHIFQSHQGFVPPPSISLYNNVPAIFARLLHIRYETLLIELIFFFSKILLVYDTRLKFIKRCRLEYVQRATAARRRDGSVLVCTRARLKRELQHIPPHYTHEYKTRHQNLKINVRIRCGSIVIKTVLLY